MSNSSQQVYNVVARRGEFLDNGEIEYDMVFLGSFLDMEQAVIHMFTIKDLDTTVDEVTIVTSRLFDDIPNADVFLSIVVLEGVVKVRTVCANSDTQPMLRDDREAFELLGYLEDMESGIDLAKKWHRAKYKTEPKVEEDISEALGDYFYDD